MRALLSLAFAANLLAQGHVELAEQAYRSGRFELARQQFEAALTAHEGAAGPLLYDLGNCCYRLGSHAEAALYYRRAQVRLPDDERVRFNLQLAQEQLGTAAPIDGPRGVLAFYDAVPPAVRLTLAALLQTTGLLGWLWLRRRGPRMAMLLCAALGLAGAVHQTVSLFSKPAVDGVVLIESLLLRQQPQAEAAAGATLQAGEVVQVLAATEQWLEVQHARGRGWVERARIGMID